MLFVLGKFGESEICNFGFAIMKEYIGYFEISMNDIFLCEIIETFKDIFDDWFCFILIKISLFPESWLKVAFIAQLCNYIAVPVASEYLMAFQHIRVIQFF